MSQTYQSQKMLNWLRSEKNKDLRDLDAQKKLLAQQIRKVNKEDLFPKQKELTLWQKIKRVILGI